MKTRVPMLLAVVRIVVSPQIDATIMNGLIAAMTVVTTAATQIADVTGIGATDVTMTAGGPMTASSALISRDDREITATVTGSAMTVPDPRGIARTVVDSAATVTTTGIGVAAAMVSTAGIPRIGAKAVTTGATIVGMADGQTVRIIVATISPTRATTTPTIWIGRPLS